MFFWDYTMFLIIPPLILALYAQSKVRSTFNKFSQVAARSRINCLKESTTAVAVMQLLRLLILRDRR